MVKMFFSVFGQTQKHVFLSVLGSAPPPQPPCVFQCFWDWSNTRVFYCFSEALYCFICHLGFLHSTLYLGIPLVLAALANRT